VNWRKREIEGKGNRKRRRKKRRTKASAGGENEPFHTMLHRHTSRIGPYSAQFKLTVGCEVIGKARPNPTFPLPWRGRFHSQGHIVRRKKCREKRMSGVVPMLGSAEADFPTNRMRKENGDWRGEAAANVTNASSREWGLLGKSHQNPNAWRPVSEDCPFGKA
jgi:hypothetical protein